VTPPVLPPAAAAVLRCHPASPCRGIDRIDVTLRWLQPVLLELAYVMHGDAAAVVLPAAGRRQFADRLWEHTCVEAFLREGDGYAELNFSPSGDWAVYRFDGYRTGMRRVELTVPSLIDVNRREQRIVITAAVSLAAFAWVRQAQHLTMALSAVIEETGGARSYWALAHPSENPDFHHAGAFALTLPVQHETVR
jgi:hypothetical protein